ncbi:DMT family transporter [Roseibium sediminicola]|uniref:DMT family transporter n=1 Tax=Roseibium sediminicola TaxID=2933272 RepID=A0ABT0GR58_9HYPH|nr:DMT family transporter [Roseibium sp. CAU 1639]
MTNGVQPLRIAPTGLEQGMIFMAVAVLIAPISHAIAKSLGSEMAPAQITVARLLFQALILAIVWRLGDRRPLPAPTMSQVIRGALLAAVFLGERLGLRRMVAIAVGFAGALVVTRPGFDYFGPAALLPLLSAVFVATVFTITRAQKAKETPLALQFWICVSGSLATVAAMTLGAPLQVPFLAASQPSATNWALLLALGAVGTVSQLLATRAVRMAPAGALAPLQYLEILSASLLGYLVFSDIPDETTLTGIAIIVSAGLYIFYRERQISRRSFGR